jgi:hypothetical protein
MQLTLVEQSEMRPVKQGRKPNEAYRVREHLTEEEVNRLLAALKANRHGHRDWLIGLLISRHRLRVSEACDLRLFGNSRGVIGRPRISTLGDNVASLSFAPPNIFERLRRHRGVTTVLVMLAWPRKCCRRLVSMPLPART